MNPQGRVKLPSWEARVVGFPLSVDFSADVAATMTKKGDSNLGRRTRVEIEPRDEKLIIRAMDDWADEGGFVAARTRAFVYLLWDGAVRTGSALRLNRSTTAGPPLLRRPSGGVEARRGGGVDSPGNATHHSRSTIGSERERAKPAAPSPAPTAS